MRILVLNYRDLKHPQAGGAEVHLHRIFGIIHKLGNEVLLVTTKFPGCAIREEVEGLPVLRMGSDFSFQFLLPLQWRRLVNDFKPDIIVEDLNKLPFFTPLFSRLPKFIQIHHLWRWSIFQEAAFPLALAVWLQEQLIPWFYRGNQFAAVSPSTVQELQGLGIPQDRIALIYNGCEESWTQVEPQHHKQPHFLWLGRLRRYKGVWVALEAMRKLHQSHPEAHLVFAGTGPELDALKKATREWGLEKVVTFKGRVSESEKQQLLRDSMALIQSSYKEGWGLTVMEAAACGTISIASDVPGLRDSVRAEKTGYLFPAGNTQALCELMKKVLDPTGARTKMEQEARHWSLSFSWEKSARTTLEILQALVPKK